jgi:hypothetical protein
MTIEQIIVGILCAARSEIGRRGGSAKSAAKAKASRRNGKRGGRPKKNERAL